MTDNNQSLGSDSIREGTQLLMGELLATALLGIGSIVVGRLLGPEEYALFGLAVVLPSLLFAFTNLGIDTSLVYFLPKLDESDRDQASQLLKVGVILRLSIATIVGIIGYTISGFFASYILNRPFLTEFVALSSLSIFFQAAFFVSYVVSLGLYKMKLGAITKVIQSGVKTIISIVLVFAGIGFVGAIYGFILGYVIAGLFGMYIMYKLYTSLHLKSEKKYSNVFLVKKLLSYGFPIFICVLIAAVFIQFRLLFVANIASDAEIGNFNAAINLSMVLTGVSFPITQALLPAFSRAKAKNDRRLLSKSFAMALRYASLIVIPSTLLMIMYSEEISLVLYGPEYVFLPLYLALFSSAFLTIGIGFGILQSFFNGIGDNKYTLGFWIVYFISFIFFGLLISPSLGVVGIFASEIVARIVSCGTALIVAKMKRGVDLGVSRLAGVYISGGLSFIFVTLFNNFITLNSILKVIIGVLLFAGIYLTILPLSKALDENDIELMEKAFFRLGPLRRVAYYVLLYERKIIQRVRR